MNNINYLRVSITSACNLFCKYCIKSDSKRNGAILSPDEILSVVRACIPLGINRFRVTGGEPLLRKDCLEIIQKISSEPGVADISLTTNGTLLPCRIKDLKIAGLKRLNISLDTLSKEKFRALTGRDLLNDVLSGITLAKSENFSDIKINTVLIKNINLDEIHNFTEFSSKFAVPVRFIELMPSGQEDEYFKENFVSANNIKNLLLKKYTLSEITQSGSGPARYYKTNTGAVIGIIASVSEEFCGSCNRLRLSSSGKMRLCLFSKNKIDLKPALKEKKFTSLTGLIEKALRLKPLNKKNKSFICGRMSEIGG